jgi:DNA-directed RNA polymerase specialized sigma24 family protein
MPEKRSIIFREKKLKGLSHKEIAEKFNISAKTVEYHITEGMKFLKNEFSKSGMWGMVFFYLFVKRN